MTRRDTKKIIATMVVHRVMPVLAVEEVEAQQQHTPLVVVMMKVTITDVMTMVSPRYQRMTLFTKPLLQELG
jgi:hypothetical protein